MSYGPFKDQITHQMIRYYTEKENDSLPSQVVSEDDCTDLTKINCQRKRKGCDRNFLKVELC